MARELLILGALFWISMVVLVKGSLSIRDYRREMQMKRDEMEAARRLLLAERWRVSNLIEQKVRDKSGVWDHRSHRTRRD